ncbi:MAG TPA: ABC transporter ATP-binding protein/permease [Paenirhodobacter sp.]
MNDGETRVVTTLQDTHAPSPRAQLGAMAQAFWHSRQRNALVALALATVVVVGATAWFQIRLNAWNEPFYDALTRRNATSFFTQLWVFAQLAAVLLVLNVAQAWLRQMSKLTLRKGLVHDLLGEWLGPQRAFRLMGAGSIGENPDQRIAADAQQLTELTTDLGIGLLQATLLLLSFVGVLWELSNGMFVQVGDVVWAPPGVMVWCALLYAGVASCLSWMVGRPLVRLDTERYAREADFRFALVRVNEDLEGIALFSGEETERRRLRHVFGTVAAMMRRLVGATTRLTWITAGYGWFTIVAPILVAAPSYFAGQMTFGELMMIVGAFNQVQSSLRWFVDNFSSIADWLATLLRVASFRQAVRAMDDTGRNDAHLRLLETTGDDIRFDHLAVASHAGTVRLEPAIITLTPGERVLVSAQHGEGKTLFFRAFAGLWPWGGGQIERPDLNRAHFLPQRAYVPPGSLRASVSYPKPSDTYSDAEIRAAMTLVGLERLIPYLDRADRWDRQLSENEKHLLSFARLSLHHPKWAVIDDVLDRIDPLLRPRIEALLAGPLADMGVILIGPDQPPGGLFPRRLRLVAQMDASATPDTDQAAPTTSDAG